MSPVDPDHRARRRAALISMGIGLLMLAGKWSAYALTGSSAIFSDALESVVHVAATAFAFASVVLAARPPDPKYPYGLGKIAYVSAGFEGALILVAAAAIVVEAIRGLLEGAHPHQLGLGLGLILLASVVNLALGLWLIRLGRRTGSLILVADGQHVLTDAYTSLGVVIGVGLVLATGLAWLDAAVALLVGLNILRTGFELVRTGAAGLLDRADPALLATIVAALQAHRPPGWLDIHQLRAWQSGDRTYVDFHLTVPAAWSVERAHDAIRLSRAAVRSALGPEAEVTIHFDPGTDPDPTPIGPPWTAEHAVRVLNDEVPIVAPEARSAIP